MNDGEAVSLHDSKDSFALVDERAVEDEMAKPRQVRVVDERRMVEPIGDDPSDRRETVPALLSQLPHGVALRDPPLEPHSMTQMLVEPVLPDKGTAADGTKPALFALSAGSIALDTN